MKDEGSSCVVMQEIFTNMARIAVWREKKLLIDAWLDLKDKKEKSFAKTDEKFGKQPV